MSSAGGELLKTEDQSLSWCTWVSLQNIWHCCSEAIQSTSNVPAGCVTNYHPQHHHNETLRYYSVRQRNFMLAYVLFSHRKFTCHIPWIKGVVAVGSVSIHCTLHYVLVYVLVWGMGNSWLRLHPAGCASGLWGSFIKAPARDCNLSGLSAQGQLCPNLTLTWHTQAGNPASDWQFPHFWPHWQTTATQLDVSHKAGRLTTEMALFLIIPDTFYTTLIPKINSFFFVFTAVMDHRF